MNNKSMMKILMIGVLSRALCACGVSAETQAKIEEYSRTIPSCSSDSDCAAKWSAARAWVVGNATLPIRSEDENRIVTYNADNQRSGTAIDVNKVAMADGSFQMTVDVECFAAYGCPNVWDIMLDFNQVVGAATPL